MHKQNRLKLISKQLTTCDKCGFVYLPMSRWTMTNCPKCKPMTQQIKYVDPDMFYIKNEIKVQEKVSNVAMFDSAPKFTQDEYNTSLAL